MSSGRRGSGRQSGRWSGTQGGYGDRQRVPRYVSAAYPVDPVADRPDDIVIRHPGNHGRIRVSTRGSYKIIGQSRILRSSGVGLAQHMLDREIARLVRWNPRQRDGPMVGGGGETVGYRQRANFYLRARHFHALKRLQFDCRRILSGEPALGFAASERNAPRSQTQRLMGGRARVGVGKRTFYLQPEARRVVGSEARRSDAYSLSRPYREAVRYQRAAWGRQRSRARNRRWDNRRWRGRDDVADRKRVPAFPSSMLLE